MSDARRDHILAGDHGWIDLTVRVSAKSPNAKAPGSCNMTLSINGEQILFETAKLAEAEAKSSPIGYRFVAPSGNLQSELTITSCVKEPYVSRLLIQLEKDHLATVAFDGKALVLQGSSSYQPTSLEWVRAEILKLQASESSAQGTLSTITNLGIGILVVNVLALLSVFWARRKH